MLVSEEGCKWSEQWERVLESQQDEVTEEQNTTLKHLKEIMWFGLGMADSARVSFLLVEGDMNIFPIFNISKIIPQIPFLQNW